MIWESLIGHVGVKVKTLGVAGDFVVVVQVFLRDQGVGLLDVVRHRVTVQGADGHFHGPISEQLL